VSNFDQTAAWKRDKFFCMASEIHILKVEKDGEDGLLVTFSDGTIGGYVVEELLEIRPIREKVSETPGILGMAIANPLLKVVPLILAPLAPLVPEVPVVPVVPVVPLVP